MTEADADLFFGREAEVKALVETVQANRLVAVVADSGAGKSSLVMAGLIPHVRGGALQDKWVPDQRVWQVVVMRPGGDPVENLRVGITEAAERLGLDGEKRAALRRRIDPVRTEEWIYALQCDLGPGEPASNPYPHFRLNGWPRRVERPVSPGLWDRDRIQVWPLSYPGPDPRRAR
jgi:energy-coupling factor transporter ATP-binding protein EcfA2